MFSKGTLARRGEARRGLSASQSLHVWCFNEALLRCTPGPRRWAPRASTQVKLGLGLCPIRLNQLMYPNTTLPHPPLKVCLRSETLCSPPLSVVSFVVVAFVCRFVHCCHLIYSFVCHPLFPPTFFHNHRIHLFSILYLALVRIG